MDTLAGEGVRFRFASDQSLLVYFDPRNEEDRAPDKVGIISSRPLESQITLQANERVRKLLQLLQLEPVAGVRNVHPAYCSCWSSLMRCGCGMRKWKRFCGDISIAWM